VQTGGRCISCLGCILLNVLINLFPLQFPLTAVREFQALKTLRHNNIVKLLDVCCTPSSISNNMIGEVYMVFEYCDADLGGLIVKEKVMHDDYIRCFTHQLLSALVYMHQQGWVHRDIKPPNILLMKDNTLKLADLGLVRSTVTCKKMTPMVCTLWYRAPELLLQDPSAREGVDVWSVGCILGEMLLGEPIFRGENELNQIAQIYRLCGVPSRESWPAVCSLPGWKLMGPKSQNTPQFASKFAR
jgi:serine/threonine protein kinase